MATTCFPKCTTCLLRANRRAFASTPTLELHIALLRRLLPAIRRVVRGNSSAARTSYDFVCCLTHDVDFFGIRRHQWDRTLAGFVYRGTIGTLFGLIQGRRTDRRSDAELVWQCCPCRLCSRDWGATSGSRLRITRLSTATAGQRISSHRSRNFQGLRPTAPRIRVRAVPYAVSDIRQEIASARAPRTEFALHGIDAWRDVESGRAEITQLTNVTGSERVGVRMHWLYFSSDSTQLLEGGGIRLRLHVRVQRCDRFQGWNSQVFRPLGQSTLMELPLSIMDSAMFYPGSHGADLAKPRWSCAAASSTKRGVLAGRS